MTLVFFRQLDFLFSFVTGRFNNGMSKYIRVSQTVNLQFQFALSSNLDGAKTSKRTPKNKNAHIFGIFVPFGLHQLAIPSNACFICFIEPHLYKIM